MYNVISVENKQFTIFSGETSPILNFGNLGPDLGFATMKTYETIVNFIVRRPENWAPECIY